ncbi:MAG: ABC transporter substrate-binding protein [Bdellovibrionales bacterium]
MIKNIIYIFSFLYFTTLTAQDSFRFHLVSDPAFLNPASISTSQANYFFSNVFSGLYKYDNAKGLIGTGAKHCKFKGSKILECVLNQNVKYHDGSRILAQDYVRAFQHLINPKNYARRVDLLFNLKNAKAIYAGEKKPEELGISAKSDKRLLFEFDEIDKDFLYKLSSPVLTPWKSLPSKPNWETTQFNGPYFIKKWIMGRKIILEANPHFMPSKKRIKNIEIIFIEEDSTALRLFEAGKLDFLRRIPASEIPFYKKKNSFLQVPMARFDYVGLTGELDKYPKLREAMTMALNYEEFKKLFHALGRAGCPAIPSTYMNQTHCYKFDLERAKALLKKVDPKVLKQRFVMNFSSAGGDDIRRAAEWFQYQWKKNLGLNIEARPMEQKVFIAQLRKNPPSIFRKGIPLDRPSCLAAMENFTSDAPENFIRLKNSSYDLAVKKLKETSGIKNSKRQCSNSLKALLATHKYIPLGRMYFTMLDNRKFKNVKLNELNQLDLTEIQLNQ